MVKVVICGVMYALGWANTAVWGLIMTYWLVMQWYAPGNILTFHFNNFGEAYIEYIIGIIMVPCTVYYLYRSFVSLRLQINGSRLP